MENAKFTGTSYSADMVCTGEMKMRGHVQFTFESPAHYYGTTTMNGMMDGRPIHNTTKIDARWLTADCGKAQ
ncbi:MAG: DUF3617 family protein [Alphaproteobacteria bacterium]|nr:DUF3617 family protein [Alphaproteobacteria bacterium]